VARDYLYRGADVEFRGPEALKAYLAGYHAAFPDLRLVIDDLMTEGERAIVLFTLTGTHEGELMGIPPTGKRIEVHGVVRSRVFDGRIREEFEMVDQFALLTQLGVLSPPGS
ncbi:MAG: ester cyclase, partial [Planctomycetota bacterium]